MDNTLVIQYPRGWDKTGTNSRALMRHLEGRGIQDRPLWQPMHLSPAHRGSYATDCLVAERLNRDGLSLPCSVGISDTEREQVISAIAMISRSAVRKGP